MKNNMTKTRVEVFREWVLNAANKKYHNNIPNNISVLLNEELEYIEQKNLIDTIYMIENMFHYDRKYIGSIFLSGDLEDSLVLYILGLTKKPDNYKIDSFNDKTYYIQFNVDELFIEDIKDEFIRLYKENIINDESMDEDEFLYLKEKYNLDDLNSDISDYCNIVSFETYNPRKKPKNLKIKIIKGTNQIGGCITEIESEKARIIVDFGEDLPNEAIEIKRENPMIDGLTTGIKKYDAVFITHSHGDHIGLIDYILDDIPVYVEKESKKIYELLNAFTYKETRFKTRNMEFEKPVIIKDMKITLFIIDHSSYNSGMLLIESEGKKILHTGDYRNHGRKGKIFAKILKEIGKVDLLITEGTTFGRKEEKYKTEEELEQVALEELKNYKQIFILQASTNIDRIVTFYKVAKKTKKIFIEDIFTANITDILDSNIPTPKRFNDVYAWIPLKYQKKSSGFKEKYFTPFEEKCNSKIVFNDFMMLVKTSMLNDLKMLKEKGAITKACLVYSMWEGYLEQESFKEFIDGVKSLGIDYKFIHTSGHGDNDARKLVEKYTMPEKVIPIHTKNKEQAKEVFKNVVILEDNEELEI